MPESKFFTRVYEAGTTKLIEHPLPLEENGQPYPLKLKSFPGAAWLHVLVLQQDKIKLRMKIQVYGEETITVLFSLDSEGEVHAHTNNSVDSYRLPPEPCYCPPYLIPPPDAGQALDIVFLIDGTARLWSSEERTVIEKGQPFQKSVAFSSSLLKDHPDIWAFYTEKLIIFLETLAKTHQNCRYSVLAFGDEAPPDTKAKALKPSYKLWPEGDNNAKLAFKNFDKNRLKMDLLAIPTTSGGDFVDALADGLVAAADLRWSDEEGTRKVLVCVGDSPGHSLIKPVPPGGDTRIRSKDVETSAMLLHHLGIEIISVYWDVSEKIKKDFRETKRTFINYTQVQYQELASSPELAIHIPLSSSDSQSKEIETSFSPEELTKHLTDRTQAIARGDVFGELVE